MKKKTFQVSLCRSSWSLATVEVEARNAQEAREKALELAGSLDYEESDAEYEVSEVKQPVVVRGS